MKKIVIFLVGFLLVGNVFSQKELIDKVIANIGGEIVLLSEVEDQYALMESQQGALPSGIRCSILDNILVQKLLVNQAKLDSLEVSDEEVEAQLSARIEQILAYMNNDVKQFEEYYGQSIEQVKQRFRIDLKNQILAERMRAQIMTNVKITPAEVKTFFNKIPKDSLPYFNSEVEIGEIVLKPQVNKFEKHKATEKLKSLLRKIREGEDFGAIAEKYSDDFASARIGGDLGWTKRGKFVPEFESAAYRLEENEISPIFESEYGFHIIQLLERRGNSIHTRHILIRPAITDDDLTLVKAKLDSIRTSIISDSLAFSRAVKKYSSDDAQSYNNDGRMVNPKTGNTFFEIGDLEPDIYFTIDTMEVGNISAPFSFTNQAGETQFRIIQLQARTDPHKANLKQDYSKIKAAAIEEKTNVYINEWILEKVNSTFIRINPAYHICPDIEKWKALDKL